MKIFKTIYNLFVIFIVIIALLLVVSIFPITGNWQVLVVESGSMEPAIKVGGLVIVKSANNYQVGDIITFRNPESLNTKITHRIYELKINEGQTFYVTKGDANEEPDGEGILARYVLGKVILALPYLGYAVDAAKKPIGFILIIAIPAVVIIGDEIRKIIREARRIRNSKKIT